MLNNKNDQIIDELIEQAILGNAESLEKLLVNVQDTVFNLSLRMLGTVTDAEDATQDILVKIITNISTFRRECTFKTWVYKIATNYLFNYKKSMFASRPLNFEFYGNDIRSAKLDEIEKLVDDLSREAFAEELKMSCTNVMLQCLDAESRCIFIMGTMFKLDSRVASEIIGITPENYRQRLSRLRKKVGEFLAYHCGLTKTGLCSCSKRIDYAVSQGRLNPNRFEYTKLEQIDKSRMDEFKDEMEHLDELACTFESMPKYKSTVSAQKLVSELLKSKSWKRVQEI